MHVSNYAEFLAGQEFQQEKGRTGGSVFSSLSSVLLLIEEPCSVTRVVIFWGICQVALQ